MIPSNPKKKKKRPFSQLTAFPTDYSKLKKKKIFYKIKNKEENRKLANRACPQLLRKAKKKCTLSPLPGLRLMLSRMQTKIWILHNTKGEKKFLNLCVIVKREEKQNFLSTEFNISKVYLHITSGQIFCLLRQFRAQSSEQAH